MEFASTTDTWNNVVIIRIAVFVAVCAVTISKILFGIYVDARQVTACELFGLLC